jgi:outer membrane protein assembly factor BamB
MSRRITCSTARLLALLVAMLVGIVVPGGRRVDATGETRRGVRWSLVLPAGPWGLAADARGAVVTVDDGSVLAVDPRGHTRWTARRIDVVEGEPAIDADTVLVGGAGGVTALGRDNGRVRWHADAVAPVTSLALAGATALAGDHAGTLTAFDAATGARRWSVHHDGRLWSGARVDPATGSVVATWHGTGEPVLQTLDLATGALRWSAVTGSGTAAPVVTHGMVVLAAGNGHFDARVEARDLATGALRWHVAVPASFEEAIEPGAGSSEVVVVDHFGTVTSLGLAHGGRRWQRALGEPVLAGRVAVTASRVVLTTYGGRVVVLGRADGRVVGVFDARSLGGYPSTGAAVRWGRRTGFLAGLRLTEPGELVLARVP